MCGITGFVGMDDEALLRAMCSSLTHRGPDESGFYTDRGVGLSMRRLAVIDLLGGKQPIHNEDRTIWVVFNGEIYNYQELTEQLKALGHTFYTNSDTEVIVHLYEEHGDRFVEHLRGMFGIAVWDSRQRRLVLARDRVGEKPLFYAADGSKLLFGSEIKSILQAGQARRVNPQAVCEFLAASYAPAPHTFFDGIRKLPPGWLLVHERGNITTRPYWQRDVHQRSALSLPQARGQLTQNLREVIRLCLKSDVEVGAFLSGGLDSSLIVALMAEHGARIQTFSVGYRGAAAGFNELNYARQVANQLGTLHHELIIEPGPNIALLPRVLWHFDEPLGEPTSVLVYMLCEFARQRVKVAMGGTGGDELFFGYPRHKGIRYLEQYRRLPRFIRRHVVEKLLGRMPESTRGSRLAKRMKRFIAGAELPPHEAYLHWVSLLSRSVRGALLHEQIRDAAADAHGDAFMRAALARAGGAELLDCAAELDTAHYLPEFQLTYMDRMSMAHGLEVRSPLSDYKLMEFALALPASYRLHGLHSKHILKQAALQWLPDSIVERPKVGFDSPVGQWFKDELRPFLLRFMSREHIERTGLLSYDAVAGVIGDHLSGQRDYSLQLWSLVVLEAWHRMYIEDGVTDASGYELGDLRGATETTRVSMHEARPLQAASAG